MELAAKNAKRILSTDGTLTDKALKDSLSYDTNEYDLEVFPSQDNDGYLVLLTSTSTGKFKNVDFTKITQNPDWQYKNKVGGTEGVNTIAFKIKSDSSIVKVPDTSDDMRIINGEIQDGCTKFRKKQASEYTTGDVISFCDRDIGIYTYSKYVNGTATSTDFYGKSEDFYVLYTDDTTISMITKNNLVFTNPEEPPYTLAFEIIKIDGLQSIGSGPSLTPFFKNSRLYKKK